MVSRGRQLGTAVRNDGGWADEPSSILDHEQFDRPDRVEEHHASGFHLGARVHDAERTPVGREAEEGGQIWSQSRRGGGASRRAGSSRKPLLIERKRRKVVDDEHAERSPRLREPAESSVEMSDRPAEDNPSRIPGDQLAHRNLGLLELSTQITERVLLEQVLLHPPRVWRRRRLLSDLRRRALRHGTAAERRLGKCRGNPSSASVDVRARRHDLVDSIENRIIERDRSSPQRRLKLFYRPWA